MSHWWVKWKRINGRRSHAASEIENETDKCHRFSTPQLMRKFRFLIYIQIFRVWVGPHYLTTGLQYTNMQLLAICIALAPTTNTQTHARTHTGRMKHSRYGFPFILERIGSNTFAFSINFVHRILINNCSTSDAQMTFSTYVGVCVDAVFSSLTVVDGASISVVSVVSIVSALPQSK